MYGLTMLKDYLNEFLDGSKTYDARSYTTNKRGTIALVDSRSMRVYGYADLVGIKEITPQEYASWHCTGRWSGCVMQVDESKKYYGWILENVRKEEKPYKVLGEKHTWVVVGEKKSKQESLF